MRYELRIEGHLDQHWSTWFGGLAVTLEGDGTTAIRGVVTDQSQLHGLLAKIRDLGVTLISVMPIDAGSAIPSEQGEDPCPSPHPRHPRPHQSCH
jgi:hypothetical protein